MKIAKNIAKAAWNGFKSAGRAIGSGIKSAGLSLGIYAVPTSEEIASFFENQGMQYMTEEVLWKNLDDEEKVGKILQYLEKISDSDRDELIIIDPYLFRTPKDNEEQNLEKILLKSNFRKIKAVVEKDKANKDYIKRISKRVSNKLEVLYSDEFHDRFQNKL